MKWTLLVPGALLPAALAPEIARAAQAPRLAQRLRQGRWRSGASADERTEGAAHWSWLAQLFGLAGDPPVTAPYAWAALDAADGGNNGETAAPAWIAHCDPVHMLIARDHLAITDLGAAPLQALETALLLDLANGAAAEAPAHEALDVRFCVRQGHWFVYSSRPLALQAAPLDAVLGRSVLERLPGGAHARPWRILSNEIQMLWHASAVNESREQRGARPVNALWIHGGGARQALAPRERVGLHMKDMPANTALVLQGWQAASADAPSPDAQVTLSVHAELFAPFAHQDWDGWLARLPGWEERLEHELAQAQRAGASVFELVLCGQQQTRSLTIGLRAAGAPLAALNTWARRLALGRAGTGQRAGAELARILAESAAPADVAGAGPPGARPERAA
jgi:hypothetical protein